jgi:hypothetical protein
MKDIILKKKVFKTDIYEDVINTEFEEFLKTKNTPEKPKVNIEDFFNYYDELFFEIPKNGESLSHEFLIKKSTQYVGENKGPLYEAMQNEITSLKKELLNSSQTINDLTTQISLLGNQLKITNND